MEFLVTFLHMFLICFLSFSLKLMRNDFSLLPCFVSEFPLLIIASIFLLPTVLQCHLSSLGLFWGGGGGWRAIESSRIIM